ncbi:MULTISPECIES: hypothetical protein [unclassified Clostridium]|uniref:hypothetical protein n=1 Tax=unclassified Clostridium TaxID=2614128 RepID=UPI0025BB4ADB|nr:MULTISPECIES: hypothetical protein [unclassified Clostridium]
MSWRDVFDALKLKFRTYDECREAVKKVGYNYLAFNGYVFSVYDVDMEHPICAVEGLK